MAEPQQQYERRAQDVLLQQVLKGQEEIKEILREMTKAFPQNEFGDPDFDGHRNDHKRRIADAQRSESDKRESASKVRNAIIIGGGTLGLTAVWEYVKAHLK